MQNLVKYLRGGIACFFSGAAITLAFAPFDYYILAVLSPALLIHAWLDTTPRHALRCGYFYGLGMFGTGVGWLHISINLFGGVNLFGALLITFTLVAFLALYPALTGYLGRRFFARSELLFLLAATPSLWLMMEWCRAWIFTGFPWLQLGYALIDSPLAGLAPVFGIYGVSFMAIFTSAALIALLRTGLTARIIIGFILLVIWTVSWSVNQKQWTLETRSDYRVALIQSGIPQELKWRPELRQQSLNLFMNLSNPHWISDLIIWPETAVPAFYHEEKEFVDSVHDLANTTRTDVLIGIPVEDRDTGKYYNSMVMLSDQVSFYHKRHLVPFGEYMPFASVLRPILNFLQIPMSDFSPGVSDKPLLRGSTVNIGVSICYEDTFGEEVIESLPEAEILVNISNDAWFGDSIAPHQHLQMARMRALETGRYLLRATNTGITAIIDEKGRIVKQSVQFEPDSLAGEASLFTGVTPYVRFGNLPVIITVLLLLIILTINKKPLKNNY